MVLRCLSAHKFRSTLLLSSPTSRSKQVVVQVHSSFSPQSSVEQFIGNDKKKMQQYANIALTFGALLIVLTASTSSASAIPLIVCHQTAMVDAPQKLRQLCALLEKAVEVPQDEGEYVDPAAMYEKHMDGRGLKRQDVDHVFLRFGRRPAGV